MPHSRRMPRDSVEMTVTVTRLEADSVIEVAVTTADTAAVAMTVAVVTVAEEVAITVIVTADILEVGMIDAAEVATRTDAVTMEAALTEAPEAAVVATEIVTVTTAVADATVDGQAVVAAVIAAVAAGRAVVVAMAAPSRVAGKVDMGLDSSSGEVVALGMEADLLGQHRAAGRSKVISSHSKPGDSGRRVTDKPSSLDSTRATATLSGTQRQLPRRGPATGSKAARAGDTPAASIRSEKDAHWLQSNCLWVVHSLLTESAVELDLFLAVNVWKFKLKISINCQFQAICGSCCCW